MTLTELLSRGIAVLTTAVFALSVGVLLTMPLPWNGTGQTRPYIESGYEAVIAQSPVVWQLLLLLAAVGVALVALLTGTLWVTTHKLPAAQTLLLLVWAIATVAAWVACSWAATRLGGPPSLPETSKEWQAWYGTNATLVSLKILPLISYPFAAVCLFGCQTVIRRWPLTDVKALAHQVS